MKCEKCNSIMVERDGRFGSFYFCPNQTNCGQKTLSAINTSNMSSFYSSSSIRSYQVRQNRLSKADKDAEFFNRGEMMMENIEFGELGGC